MHRRLLPALALAAVACSRTPADTPPRDVRPPVGIAPESSRPIVERRPPAAHASVERARDSAPQPVVSRAMALRHVAAIDATHVFAVGAGVLYRLDGDHWRREPLQGAEARDVVATHGALWILAKGEGDNRGRCLIIRSSGDDDLLAVATPDLGAESEPRALAVAREGEYFIGGTHPALVSVENNVVNPLHVAAPDVVTLRRLHDEMLVAEHADGRVSVGRWGEATTTTLSDYVDTLVDPLGIGFLLRSHGLITRGRPGREMGAVTTPVTFNVRAAAALGHDRLALVGARGPFADWHDDVWHIITGPFPPDPIAILATDPPLVVGSDGDVAAVTPHGVRIVVHSASVP